MVKQKQSVGSFFKLFILDILDILFKAINEHILRFTPNLEFLDLSFNQVRVIKIKMQSDPTLVGLGTE